MVITDFEKLLTNGAFYPLIVDKGIFELKPIPHAFRNSCSCYF